MLTVACTPSATDTGPSLPSTTAALGKQFDAFLAMDATGAYDNLRAVRVTVAGTVVLDRHFPASANASLNVESVGKTILGTLVGIAIDEGLLRGLDQPLAELLPRYRADMGPEVRSITVRQLITMSAGLPTDDVFYRSVFDTPKDWVATILSTGTTDAGAGSFSYSSAGSHLLSAVLSDATGRSLLDYAREKLFDPLGIDTVPAAEPVALVKNRAQYERARFAWPTDPQGRNIGGGGMKLTASDLSKLGQLWLDGGVWKGRQLVSRSWLAASQAPQISTDGRGLTDSYGFHQWVTTSAGHDAFAALGFGGQLVEVVPDLDLVVVMQSRTLGDPRRDRPEPGSASEPEYLAIVDNLIAPAVG
jgi:CubicO group peptidase (beta-lactamase class C family)